MKTETVACGLGWFSIALGVIELVAPRTISRSIGLRSDGLVQSYGLREIGHGVSILASKNRSPWLWTRVAGDALDIATLSLGLTHGNPKRANAGKALAAVAAITAVDVLTATRLSRGKK